MANKKLLTPTFLWNLYRLIREISDDITDEFPGCCGMSIIHGLDNCDIREQLAALFCAFYGDNLYWEDDGKKGFLKDANLLVAQVIITDTLKSTTWAETKEVAIQGPISTNPNSGNKICHWTILPEHLLELVQMLPKDLYNEYFVKEKKEKKKPSKPLSQYLKRKPAKKVKKGRLTTAFVIS